MYISLIHKVYSFFIWQVPPDFYIPDFDEDEQDPDERVDRKLAWPICCYSSSNGVIC